MFAGGQKSDVEQVNITHWTCGLEAIFKYQRSGVFQCWLQFVHTSSNWTCVLLLQAVDIGAGDSSCKDRNKNAFAFGSFCLSENVLSINSPGCPPPPSCLHRDESPGSSPLCCFPINCPSVAAELSGSSQLIEIEWNPNKTAGRSYGLDFGVVWKYLFVHSLQMALQQNSLIHRGSLSFLCRCDFLINLESSSVLWSSPSCHWYCLSAEIQGRSKSSFIVW